MDWVILRPENHISTTDEYGQFHLQKEIFSNSIDECEISPGGEIVIYLFLDKKKNTWQTAIRDNGRGVPLGKLRDSFMSEMTSGKFDKDAYITSGGLNGVGSSVVVALSEHFKVISKRDGKIGQLYVNRTEEKECTVIKNPEHPLDHGTLVVFEPRKKFFSNVDVFIDSRYDQLIHLAQLISLFSHNTHIVVKMINKSIDPAFWTMGALEADEFIEQNYEQLFIPLMDGADYDSVIAFLKETWGVDSDFIWSVEDQYLDYKFTGDIKKDIGYTLNLYLPKIQRALCATTLINNVPIKDQMSSPVIAITQAIKNKIFQYIENPEIQEYFLNIYKLPMCIAVSVKYGDVKFDGLAKHAFKNVIFEKEFLRILNDDFNTLDPILWENLYNSIEKDIELKYNIYYNKPLITSKKNSGKISVEMGSVFYGCSSKSGKDAELFIVEGVSADHIVTARDTDFQAMYMIFGKPINSYRSANINKRGGTSLSVIRKYPAYTKLIELLNIQPGQTDLSEARFKKIILMSDADVDGSHIRALHLGALYVINPLIISSGMVYLANPPLYEIRIGNDKKAKKKFVRNKEDFIDFKIECLYKPTLKIKIGDGNAFKEPVELTGDDYTTFCQLIIDIGERFDDVAKRLAIPHIVLEKLTYLTRYMQPGREKYEELVNAFGKGTKYNSRLNALTIIDGDSDVSFYLDGITAALYDEVFPALHAINWKNLNIYVSTIYSNCLKDTKISITQLYKIFESLDSKLSVTRQKGLGGMSPMDLKETCLNPNTRLLHHITGIGDYNRIQALLGDEVTARKEILQRRGLD